MYLFYVLVVVVGRYCHQKNKKVKVLAKLTVGE
jgi:hypothetical protein